MYYDKDYCGDEIMMMMRRKEEEDIDDNRDRLGFKFSLNSFTVHTWTFVPGVVY